MTHLSWKGLHRFAPVFSVAWWLTWNCSASRMTRKETIRTCESPQLSHIFTSTQNTTLVIHPVNKCGNVHVMCNSWLEIICNRRQRLFVSRRSKTIRKYFWHTQNYYHLKHWLLSLILDKTQTCRIKVIVQMNVLKSCDELNLLAKMSNSFMESTHIAACSLLASVAQG